MSLDLVAVLSNEATQGVDARELHRILGVGRDFSTWMKERFARFGFVEDRDYTLLDSPDLGNQVGHGGDRRSVDYVLSLNAAEMIALDQNNEAARAARAALLKIKDAWNRPESVMARALQMAHAQIVHVRSEAEQALAAVRPQLEAFDRLASARGDLSIRKAAHVLGIAERRLIAHLLEDKVMYRDARERLQAYAEHLTAGRFRVRAVVIGEEEDGRDRLTDQPLVTALGLIWLQRRYPADAVPTTSLARRPSPEASH